MTASEVTGKQKGRLKKRIIAILAVLLVVAISVGLFIFAQRYPDKVKEFSNYGYLGVFIGNLISSATVILPVGGGFDVYSGEKKRAPQWAQNLGIEWLWRSIYDRSRGKLIYINFLPFIKIILEEVFKQRILRKKRA